MSEPFLAEIRMFSFGFAPRGWALCNGQLLPINQNQATFSLLGTTFGGDGRVNFALPDLRGRVPIHVGNGHTLGERAGQETHTVSVNEMPTHLHPVQVRNTAGTTGGPTDNMIANYLNGFGPATNVTTLAPSEVTNSGGSQPHVNLQPFLTLNFAIALQGIFPSPT